MFHSWRKQIKLIQAHQLVTPSEGFFFVFLFDYHWVTVSVLYVAKPLKFETEASPCLSFVLQVKIDWNQSLESKKKNIVAINNIYYNQPTNQPQIYILKIGLQRKNVVMLVEQLGNESNEQAIDPNDRTELIS